MKIVDRKTFLALPAGTLFAKYTPCLFGSLEIKGESLTNDFFAQELSAPIKCAGDYEFSDILYRAEADGCEVELDFCNEYRDGLYEKDQLFAVYSKEDVCLLISRLEATLRTTSPPP